MHIPNPDFLCCGCKAIASRHEGFWGMQGLRVQGNLAEGQNQYHFGVGAPPILEPILVVGLGCSLGANRFGF